MNKDIHNLKSKRQELGLNLQGIRQIVYLQARLCIVHLKRAKRRISGQATLEIGLAITVAIILIAAGISTWKWANKSMVERFEEYKASRHAAVRSVDDSEFGKSIEYSTPELKLFSPR